MDDGDIQYFDEAAAAFLQALESRDIDEVHPAQIKAGESLRRVLEKLAAACGMTHAQMCVVAMMAVSSMAREGAAQPPTVRRAMAKIGSGGTVDGAAAAP